MGFVVMIGLSNYWASNTYELLGYKHIIRRYTYTKNMSSTSLAKQKLIMKLQLKGQPI